MSETIQAWVDDEFKTDVDVEASKRGKTTSEFVKEVLQSEINSGSLEDQLETVEEELRQKIEERNKLDAEISRLEEEKESIEKRIEGQKVVDEEYDQLVEQVATDYIEYEPQTYTVHQKWDSVVDLADSEEVARADVEHKIESLQAGDEQ